MKIDLQKDEDIKTKKSYILDCTKSFYKKTITLSKNPC